MNKICPKCKGINTPIDVSVSDFHVYDSCRNIIGTKKLFGIFTINEYCNAIPSGNELGVEFDDWIYEKEGITALKNI